MSIHRTSSDDIHNSRKQLTSVFSRIQCRLKRLATRLLNEEEAEDALQDAFVKLWTKAYIDKDERELEKLCMTTVQHITIDTLRKQKKEGQSINEDVLQDMSSEENDEVDMMQRYEEVTKIMQQILTKEQYDMMYRRECLGEDYESIAESFSMNVTAVRMQISRARRKMQSHYQQYYER